MAKSSLDHHNSSSPFNCIVFDLDDTLYPLSTGIAEAVKRNIEEFLMDKCGFSKENASTSRIDLFKTYGSTLAGLRALGYDITADDYHGFVHGRLPYDAIKPNPQLRDLLRNIKQRKIIFTNSDRIHAMKVLKRLGLEECWFDQIICFETLNPNLPKSTRPDEFPIVLKPSMEAMKIAVHVAAFDPQRTLFLDDNPRNVAAAKALGLHTVLVGKTVKTKEADYAAERVNELRKMVPEIWGKRFGNKSSRSQIQEIDTVRSTATTTTTFVGA